MSSEPTKRAQMIAQLRAVVLLAEKVVRVHEELLLVYEERTPEQLVDIVGRRTAAFMEDLSNILISADDELSFYQAAFLAETFANARRLWPTSTKKVQP